MKRPFILLLCIILSLLLLCGCKGQQKGSDADLNNSVENIEDILYENGEITASTPDETGARPGRIPGFTPEKDLSQLRLPCIIKGSSLQLIALGSYSGYYTEDGTDDTVTDISAVVVQNIGQKCIKNATVTLVGKDSKEYAFAITTLPAGCSALVLESHRNTWQEGEGITHVSGVSEELDTLELQSDKLDISFKNDKFYLKNLTETDFRAVYIRYKNYTAGNVYMGGVTYSATIDNVTAFGEFECESAHYFEGYSKILMVQIVE